MNEKDLSDQLREIAGKLEKCVRRGQSIGGYCSTAKSVCKSALIQIDRLSALAWDVEFYESRKRAADFERLIASV